MIVIGLGSNFGDRLAYLREAVKLLRQSVLTNISLSPIYESEALMLPDSPAEWNVPYLNMAIAGETHLSPEHLLSEVKCLEKHIGREFRGRWAPREIDIDILAYEDSVVKTDNLIIPHLELCNRAFAIIPFADLLPNWRYPADGEFKGKTAYDIAGHFSFADAGIKETNYSINPKIIAAV